MPEKMVYGGYINFPIPPKDAKNIQKLVDENTHETASLEIIQYLVELSFGLKIEQNQKEGVWKVVIYNTLQMNATDNHIYYISGESDTLVKALCVVRYKWSVLDGQNLAGWVNNKPTSEFR